MTSRVQLERPERCLFEQSRATLRCRPRPDVETGRGLTEQRPALGHLRDPAKHGQAHEEAIGRLSITLAERRASASRLGPWQVPQAAHDGCAEL
jgi:hypothetical protein